MWHNLDTIIQLYKKQYIQQFKTVSKLFWNYFIYIASKPYKKLASDTGKNYKQDIKYEMHIPLLMEEANKFSSEIGKKNLATKISKKKLTSETG